MLYCFGILCELATIVLIAWGVYSITIDPFMTPDIKLLVDDKARTIKERGDKRKLTDDEARRRFLPLLFIGILLFVFFTVYLIESRP